MFMFFVVNHYWFTGFYARREQKAPKSLSDGPTGVHFFHAFARNLKGSVSKLEAGLRFTLKPHCGVFESLFEVKGSR